MSKGIYRFKLYRDADRLWRWRFSAPNGEIVATAEAYKTKRAASKSINLLKTHAAAAV